MEIKRERYLKQLMLRRGNGFIKVITGIRRCGKSYLLNTIFYNQLLAEKVSKSQIIRFAFDSATDLQKIGENPIELEQEKRKVDPLKFVNYIQKKIRANKNYYLLLDEVQLLGSFESVLNGYLRQSNLDVFVTGSNSKFLSSDVLTEFAGRGDEIHVLPLSFSEFQSAFSGTKEEALEEYLMYGGLPAVALMQTDEQKMNYLSAQFKNIYLRDIVSRYGLESDVNLAELVDVLSSGMATLVNPRKLENTFKTLKGASLCQETIAKYIAILEEAFIIKRVNRYDVKGKRYINTPYKIYFEDLGLRNARLNFRQIEKTHLMENVLYNELRYRGCQVDVGVVEVREKNGGARKQLEIDFVANMGSRRHYVQSAYDIPDEVKWQQETRSFDNTKDSFQKIVVVANPVKAHFDEKGYKIVGIHDFLLGEMLL